MHPNDVWCYAHKRWEDANDPYDFPVSSAFRNGLIATGRMPNYGYVEEPAFVDPVVEEQELEQEKPQPKPSYKRIPAHSQPAKAPKGAIEL